MQTGSFSNAPKPRFIVPNVTNPAHVLCRLAHSGRDLIASLSSETLVISETGNSGQTILYNWNARLMLRRFSRSRMPFWRLPKYHGAMFLMRLPMLHSVSAARRLALESGSNGMANSATSCCSIFIRSKGQKVAIGILVAALAGETRLSFGKEQPQ